MWTQLELFDKQTEMEYALSLTLAEMEIQKLLSGVYDFTRKYFR